jgi:hypothetical protein
VYNNQCIFAKKIYTMKSYLSVFVICFPIFIYSQNNASEQKVDSLRIKYQVSSDFTFTLGNLRSFTTINKGQLDIEKRVIGSKISAEYRYGIIDTTVNSNELIASLQLSFFPKHRVYGFINGGLESSFLRGIAYRGYGGLGVGVRVIKTEQHTFEPFLNVLYEYNRYRDPIQVAPDTNYVLQTVRAVVGWTGLHKVINNKMVITHNFKYQQSLQNAQNFRFEGSVSFRYPIIKILSVKAGFTGTFENVVPTGRRQEDFIWTIGLVLTNL